jgi:hypothetical protein
VYTKPTGTLVGWAVTLPPVGGALTLAAPAHGPKKKKNHEKNNIIITKHTTGEQREWASKRFALIAKV